LSPTQQQQIQTALSNFDCNAAQDEPDLVNKTFLACEGGQLAYLLGPVIVPGHEISGASAQAPNVSQGQTEWTVSLSLKSTGQTRWAKYTGAHNIGSTKAQPTSVTQCGASATPCADYVAFTLDGNVISAPVNEEPINGGKTQISGSFTPKSSKQLADQLKYGALPLSFKNEEAQTVSATLGSSQLKAGLLAGGIGLVLVVIYSLIYYRALGLVTIASLLVSGGLMGQSYGVRRACVSGRARSRPRSVKFPESGRHGRRTMAGYGYTCPPRVDDVHAVRPARDGSRGRDGR